ncbi:cupin domain-containing protein [Streptomyces sp. NPDC002788]
MRSSPFTPVASRDLVASDTVRRYLFVEHRLRPDGALTSRPPFAGYRTFLVFAGSVRLVQGGGDHDRVLTPLEGWHAPPGSVFACAAAGPGDALLLEAGCLPERARPVWPDAPEPCHDLSDYTVTKPWGSEVWYTQNAPDCGYVVKRIRMEAGHRSSLQSHRRKTETNYVVDGVAEVLNGVPAPDGPGTPVAVPSAAWTRHTAGTFWTSPPDTLHRVVAEQAYTSVEVSTTELDDVVRWADDTGRADGRITAEHPGGRA